MFRIAKWIAPAVALALIVSFTAARAAAEEKQPAGKGTITGTVKDKDGSPVASAPVRLFNPMEQRKKPAAETQAADPAAPGADKVKKEKPTPVAEATTDAEGKFTLPDVPAGSYRVVCAVKGKGRGNQKVEVKAGETATVDIKLAEQAAKKPKA